jgi:hypothetical protein
MLIGCDDDDVLEEADAALPDDEEVPATQSDDSEPLDVGVDPAALRVADFSLLQQVVEVVKAHKQGGAAAGAKMVELRRGIRLVEARFAALHHALSGPSCDPEVARALVESRADLLAGTKRRAQEEATHTLS